MVVLPFNDALASLPAQDFIRQVLIQGLGVGYVLVGDDFRFGASAGDYARSTPPAGPGFDVARMLSYEVHGLRVSSSAVRDALARGDMRRCRRPARQTLCDQRPRRPRPQAGRQLGRASGRQRLPGR